MKNMVSKINQEKKQLNLWLDSSFIQRMRDGAEELGVKRPLTQIVAEIVEEFYDLWYVGELVKRQKVDQVKAIIRSQRQSGIDLDPAVIIAEKEGAKKNAEYEAQMLAAEQRRKRKTS